MNLDIEAAKAAQEIISEKKQSAKDMENLITKTLGVLQENGVYACMLFLYSRTANSDKISEHVRQKLLQMTELLEKKPVNPDKSDDVLKFLTENICNDIDTLLLTKQLWEQTLIYARYGAKAAPIEKL